MPSATSILRNLPLLLCVFWISRLVSAQDFYHAAVSAETASRAGIYSPNPANVVDAVSLNPAGLTALDHASANTLLLSGIAWGSFSNSANDHSSMRLRPGFVPFGAVGAPVGAGRLRLALSLTPEMLSSVHWRYGDSPAHGRRPTTGRSRRNPQSWPTGWPPPPLSR